MDIEVFTSVRFSAVIGVGTRVSATEWVQTIEVMVIYIETEKEVSSHESILYTMQGGARCRIAKYHCKEDRTKSRRMIAEKMEVVFDGKEQYWNIYKARKFITEWANLNEETFIITKVEGGTYLCSVKKNILEQMRGMGIPISYELDTMTGEISSVS